MQFDQAQDDLAISLWEARCALRPLLIEASRQLREAQSRLPDWAAPGQCYLKHDGSLSGGLVGWPAIQGMEPPKEPGVSRLIRPGKHDIERHYNLEIFTPQQRAVLLKRKRSELAQRLRAQRNEERRAGVLAANWVYEALIKRIDAIDEQIDGLTAVTPIATAVLIVRETMFQADADDPLNSSAEAEIALLALRFLRPFLSGLIKSHVDEWLDNPEMRLDHTKAYVYGCGESDHEMSQAA